ncbi:MAG: T9SS type A sorting domain-containing protein [Bacteroidetes bacterium]|nr:T9SS type A sorting domain-containing protein [Bacteroidota bacterium]MBS1975314.1 T9SS type A sorting domain-containing protein [Bacteroidota bacterium]
MRIFYILFITLLTTLQVKSQSQQQAASLQEPDAKHVKFYPNPASSFITFDFLKESDQGYSFQIYNFLGKKVYEASANSKTIVNLTDFTRGIYIFQLKDQNGRVIETGKFQVNK